LIDFFGWRKILMFITQHSRELEIGINPIFILQELIDNSDCCSGEDEEYIKKYTQLFIKKEKEKEKEKGRSSSGLSDVECVLYHSNFKSLNLFLFFWRQIEELKLTSALATVSIDLELSLKRIATKQTNLKVVKWLMDHGVGVEDFIHGNYFYDNGFFWKNGVRRYFDGKDLETLIFLINYNDLENNSRDDTNDFFEVMLSISKQNCQNLQNSRNPQNSENLQSPQQLLFRLLVRNANLDKVFLNSDLGTKEYLETKKVKVKLFRKKLLEKV
jgi:hypothetical protein